MTARLGHAMMSGRLRLAFVVSALLLVACDKTTTLPEPVASKITIAGGDWQLVTVGTLLETPLAARVSDGDGRPVPHIKVSWQITSGSGDLWDASESVPAHEPVSMTDARGIARVNVVFTTVGMSAVTARMADVEAPSIKFTTNVARKTVVVRFGPLFDCTGRSDPSRFADPTGSSNVIVPVGQPVEWIYAPGLSFVCTARIVSTSVPPGGKAFDSQVINAGDSFVFVPEVSGTWEFTDSINGGRGTLTARVP